MQRMSTSRLAMILGYERLQRLYDKIDEEKRTKGTDRCQDTLHLVRGRPEHVEIWKADLTKAVEAGVARTYLYLCGSFHYPQIRAFLQAFTPPITPVIVGVDHNEVEIELHQEAIVEETPTGAQFAHAWGLPVMAKYDPIKGWGSDPLSPGDWGDCSSFEFENSMRALFELRRGEIDSKEWLRRLRQANEVCESTLEESAFVGDLSIPN